MGRDARAAARRVACALVLAVSITAPGVALARPAHVAPRWSHGGVEFHPRSLDGWGNNPVHPSWGAMGTEYQRLAPARYGDGVGSMPRGPNPRYISNRVFDSLGVDLFSERNVSQWAWVWAQFLDHTFGLAQSGADDAAIPVRASDPLESFSDTLRPIPFARDAVALGTGT